MSSNENHNTQGGAPPENVLRTDAVCCLCFTCKVDPLKCRTDCYVFRKNMPVFQKNKK